MSAQHLKEVTSINTDIAYRIKQLREMAGMSQLEFAEQIGVSYQQVQKYENGKNKVSVERLCQIAEVFKVEINYFFPKIEKRKKFKVFSQKDTFSLDSFLNDEERKLLRVFKQVKNAKFKRGILLQLQAICNLENEHENNKLANVDNLMQ